MAKEYSLSTGSTGKFISTPDEWMEQFLGPFTRASYDPNVINYDINGEAAWGYEPYMNLPAFGGPGLYAYDLGSGGKPVFLSSTIPTLSGGVPTLAGGVGYSSEQANALIKEIATIEELSNLNAKYQFGPSIGKFVQVGNRSLADPSLVINHPTLGPITVEANVTLPSDTFEKIFQGGVTALLGAAFGGALGPALGTVGAGAVGGGVSGLVGSQGDLEAALTGAALGGLGAAAQPLASSLGGGALGQTAAGALTGAAKAAITGGDIAQGALTGGLGGAAKGVELGDVADLTATPDTSGFDLGGYSEMVPPLLEPDVAAMWDLGATAMDEFDFGDFGGLTDYDLGLSVLPWTTDPALADLDPTFGWDWGAATTQGAWPADIPIDPLTGEPSLVTADWFPEGVPEESWLDAATRRLGESFTNDPFGTISTGLKLASTAGQLFGALGGGGGAGGALGGSAGTVGGGGALSQVGAAGPQLPVYPAFQRQLTPYGGDWLTYGQALPTQSGAEHLFFGGGGGALGAAAQAQTAPATFAPPAEVLASQVTAPPPVAPAPVPAIPSFPTPPPPAPATTAPEQPPPREIFFYQGGGSVQGFVPWEKIDWDVVNDELGAQLRLGRTYFLKKYGMTPEQLGPIVERRGRFMRANGGALSRLAKGDGGGQDDKIEALLSDGEYVLDAEIVSALGDGSNDEGARRLDAWREKIRTHKRAAPRGDIPPKAKRPDAYMRST